MSFVPLVLSFMEVKEKESDLIKKNNKIDPHTQQLKRKSRLPPVGSVHNAGFIVLVQVLISKLLKSRTATQPSSVMQ